MDRDQQEPATEAGRERDYGGLDPHTDEVDVAAASDVAADPPGGLGAAIGGGADDVGQNVEAPAER